MKYLTLAEAEGNNWSQVGQVNEGSQQGPGQGSKPPMSKGEMKRLQWQKERQEIQQGTKTICIEYNVPCPFSQNSGSIEVTIGLMVIGVRSISFSYDSVPLILFFSFFFSFYLQI